MQHNLLLLKYLNDFTKLKAPICVGLSRKQLIGDITSKPIEKRLIGGIAAALYATRHGANIVRTHDVAATIDALEVVNSINSVDLPL
jgi:dihydropteroate synthase